MGALGEGLGSDRQNVCQEKQVWGSASHFRDSSAKKKQNLKKNAFFLSQVGPSWYGSTRVYKQANHKICASLNRDSDYTNAGPLFLMPISWILTSDLSNLFFFLAIGHEPDPPIDTGSCCVLKLLSIEHYQPPQQGWATAPPREAVDGRVDRIHCNFI